MSTIRIRHACDGFFAKMDRSDLALGYGDVRLRTDHSKVLPKDVDLRTMISRNVSAYIPVLTSPMDTVTEGDMAVRAAEEGGMGVIHKNLSPEEQAKAVDMVKHKIGGFVHDPVCIRQGQTVKEVLEFVARKKFGFLSFPVLNDNGSVVGIVTSSDFEFCMSENKKISNIMTSSIISASSRIGVKGAHKKMMSNHIKILPVFDRDRKLLGIYTLADVKRNLKGNSLNYNLAPDGTLRVGAAIGVGEDAQYRMQLLAKAKVDVVVIDTAHGDSAGVIAMVKWCKKNYPNIDVIAGNISEPDSAKRLALAGVDGIRVGQGPGSICTTRIIAGVGCPQVTAIYNCSKILRGSGVTVCADGGIEYSGDITIAIGAGADTVMLGKLLAGTTESPGDIIRLPGQKPKKEYRGMGSLGAMKDNQASRERYGQAGNSADKLVPEGIETEVDFKGPLGDVLHQLLGGLRSGMGYCGAHTIYELQKKANFRRITQAGRIESHPHVGSFKSAPNYAG